jgi:hypothetical protein
MLGSWLQSHMWRWLLGSRREDNSRKKLLCSAVGPDCLSCDLPEGGAHLKISRGLTLGYTPQLCIRTTLLDRTVRQVNV